MTLAQPAVHPLPPAELLALLSRVAADPGAWAAAVSFSSGTRHWSRLPAPDGVDLWLLTWLPDQATDLHDHGDSAAAFTVLSGVVEEVRVEPARQRRRTTRLATGRTRWMPPGELHDVRGAPDGPAVTLHAYSPPLTRMTFYDDALRPVRTVQSDEPEQEGP